MSLHPSTDKPIDPTVLAKLLLALKPITPHRQGSLRASVLERIRGASRHVPELLTLHADEGEWTALTPLVEMKILFDSRSTHSKTFLLRMQPGASLPAHSHPVDEECLVLEGEVMLGDVVVRTGDYHLAPKGVAHGLIRTTAGALLFVRTGARDTTCP